MPLVRPSRPAARARTGREHGVDRGRRSAAEPGEHAPGNHATHLARRRASRNFLRRLRLRAPARRAARAGCCVARLLRVGAGSHGAPQPCRISNRCASLRRYLRRCLPASLPGGAAQRRRGGGQRRWGRRHRRLLLLRPRLRPPLRPRPRLLLLLLLQGRPSCRRLWTRMGMSGTSDQLAPLRLFSVRYLCVTPNLLTQRACSRSHACIPCSRSHACFFKTQSGFEFSAARLHATVQCRAAPAAKCSSMCRMRCSG